jgi:hypothetical protein
MLTRRLPLAALLAALCFAAIPAVASAQPCWKRVISDWTKDGKIDGKYSPHCLRTAYKKTPEDLRDYSSILDDINAALIAKSSSRGSSGGTGGGPTGGTTPTNGPNSPATAAAQKRTAEKARKAAEHAVPGAGTPSSAPGHDREIPLPLILLAVVLVGGAIAGAAPHGIKWYRGRFPRVRPSTGSVRPPA